MNVYSELLDLLRPMGRGQSGLPVLAGTLTALSPLTVTLRGTEVTKGLAVLDGRRFDREDLGRTLALAPLEDGLLILGFLEGGAA